MISFRERLTDSATCLTNAMIEEDAKEKGISRAEAVEEVALRLLLHFSPNILPRLMIDSVDVHKAIQALKHRLELVESAIRLGKPIEDLPQVSAYLRRFPAGGDTSAEDLLVLEKRRAILVSSELRTFPSMHSHMINGYPFPARLGHQAATLYSILKEATLFDLDAISAFYYKYTALYRNKRAITWMELAREWAEITNQEEIVRAFEKNLPFSWLVAPPASSENFNFEVPVSFEEYVQNATVGEYESFLGIELTSSLKEDLLQCCKDEDFRMDLIYYLGHPNILVEQMPRNSGHPAFKWLLALRRFLRFTSEYSVAPTYASILFRWILFGDQNLSSWDDFTSFKAVENKPSLNGHVCNVFNCKNLLTQETVFEKHALSFLFAVLEKDPLKLSVDLETVFQSTFFDYCTATPESLRRFLEKDDIDKFEYSFRVTALILFLKGYDCVGVSTRFFSVVTSDHWAEDDIDALREVFRRSGIRAITTDSAFRILYMISAGVRRYSQTARKKGGDSDAAIVNYMSSHWKKAHAQRAKDQLESGSPLNIERVVRASIANEIVDVITGYRSQAKELPCEAELSIALNSDFDVSLKKDVEEYPNTTLLEWQKDLFKEINQWSERFAFTPAEVFNLFARCYSQTPKIIEEKLRLVSLIEAFIGVEIEKDLFYAIMIHFIELGEVTVAIETLTNLRGQIVYGHLSDASLPKEIIKQIEGAVGAITKSVPQGAVSSQVGGLSSEFLRVLFSAFLHLDNNFLEKIFTFHSGKELKGEHAILIPFGHETSLRRIAKASWIFQEGSLPLFELGLTKTGDFLTSTVRVHLNIVDKTVLQDPQFWSCLSKKAEKNCDEVFITSTDPDLPEKFKPHEKAIDQFLKDFTVAYRRGVMELAMGKPLGAETLGLQDAKRGFIHPLADGQYSLTPNIQAILGKERKECLMTCDSPDELFQNISEGTQSQDFFIHLISGNKRKVSTLPATCIWESGETEVRVTMSLITEEGKKVSITIPHPRSLLSQKALRWQLAALKSRYYYNWSKE